MVIVVSLRNIGRELGSSYIVSFVHIQVGIQVPLVSSPHSASHTGPGLLDSKNTFDIVALNFIARDRINDSWLDTEERKGCTAGLGGGDSTKRGDDI
jgi:hypothetical protein